MLEAAAQTVSPRHILIVGASSAVGCELIRQIASPDWVVLAHCHTGADRIAALQRELPSRLVPLVADISTEAGVAALLEGVASQTPCPDQIVFLAAPRFTLTRFKNLDWRDFSAQLELQLRSAVAVLSLYLPRMAKAQRGKVVFMLSSYTEGTPPAAMAHYVTGKYAMLGLMKALAAEYAGKKICINALSPSMIETPFLADIPSKLVEMTADSHPRKRNATPADVAPALRFLLSAQADFITGCNLAVTGGG